MEFVRGGGRLCGNGVHAGSFRLFASQKSTSRNFLRSIMCGGRLTVAALPKVRKWSSCAEGDSHAQAPSVPIRRAARRARDEIQALPYALRGEKSPIGGICNFSVAPHLHRKSLREVRLAFFLDGRWSGSALTQASEAIQRHVGTLLFWHFFLLCKEKSALSPERGMEIVRRGEFVRNWSARGLLPSPAVTASQLFAREILFALA